MRQIPISPDKRDTIFSHLSFGKFLGIGDLKEKIGWIRKARILLMMLDPNLENSPTGILKRSYLDLQQDLLSIDTETDEVMYSYKVEERFRSAKSTIEAVLECIDFSPEAILGTSGQINPYFFDLPTLDIENLAFVLMPFSKEWSNRIWADHIKPTVEEIEISPPLICKRADNLYGPDVLLDIFSAIKISRFVIADLTSKNPNVFYELGIAHTLGQRVILLTQAVEDIPADLLRFRYIVYKDNSDGYHEMKQRLKSSILEIIA